MTSDITFDESILSSEEERPFAFLRYKLFESLGCPHLLPRPDKTEKENDHEQEHK